MAGEVISSCSVSEVDLKNDIRWFRDESECKHPRYERKYFNDQGNDGAGKKFTIVRTLFVPVGPDGEYDTNKSLEEETTLKNLVPQDQSGVKTIKLTLVRFRPDLRSLRSWDTSNEFEHIHMIVENWFLGDKAKRDDIIKNYGSIEEWDVSEVTSMIGLFQLRPNQHPFVRKTKRNFDLFNENIGLWDVSNVRNMEFMFNGAKTFDKDISSWDTSKVTDMSLMFKNAVSFNNGGKPLITWDTSKVTLMNEMFQGAEKFNVDIKLWNTENVVNMESMFEGASDFDQELKGWNVRKVERMNNIFKGTRIKRDSLVNWNWELDAMNSWISASKITLSGNADYWIG